MKIIIVKLLILFIWLSSCGQKAGHLFKEAESGNFDLGRNSLCLTASNTRHDFSNRSLASSSANDTVEIHGSINSAIIDFDDRSIAPQRVFHLNTETNESIKLMLNDEQIESLRSGEENLVKITMNSNDYWNYRTQNISSMSSTQRVFSTGVTVNQITPVATANYLQSQMQNFQLSSPGQRKLLTVLVNYTNAQTKTAIIDSNLGIAYVRNQLNHVRNHYRTITLNKVDYVVDLASGADGQIVNSNSNLTLSPDGQPDVVTVTLNTPSTSCSGNVQTVAVPAKAELPVSLKNLYTDFMYVVSISSSGNPSACDFSIAEFIPGKQTVLNHFNTPQPGHRPNNSSQTLFSLSFILHELGHTIGYYHARGPTGAEYGNYSCFMGDNLGTPSLTPVYVQKFNYFDSHPNYLATAGGQTSQHDLGIYADLNSWTLPKILKVPVPGTNPLYVAYRTIAGLDSPIGLDTSAVNQYNGVQTYEIYQDGSNHIGSKLLNYSKNPGNEYTYNSSQSTVKIKFLQTITGGAKVEVSYTGQAPGSNPTPNPSASPTPNPNSCERFDADLDIVEANKLNNNQYEIEVKLSNNDVNCSANNYTLTLASGDLNMTPTNIQRTVASGITDTFIIKLNLNPPGKLEYSGTLSAKNVSTQVSIENDFTIKPGETCQ